MSSYLRPRRGTLANAKSTLTTSAPLKSGEVFFECENIGNAQGKIKLGNGSSHYSSLPYFLSMQDSSIGFTNSTNSVSTADSSFLNSSILSTSAHSTVMYAVKQLLWNHTQKIAALNSRLSTLETTVNTLNTSTFTVTAVSPIPSYFSALKVTNYHRKGNFCQVQMEMTISTAITSDWVKIATMNVSVADGFTNTYQMHMQASNQRGENGSGSRMKFKIDGSNIYGFFGLPGIQYNPNFIFFCK